MLKQKSPIEQPYQEHAIKPRNILFVCRANLNRSPTGEKVFKQMLNEKGYLVFDQRNKKTWADYDVKVSSAGTDTFKEDKTNQLEGEVADAADIIFTFDEGLEYVLIHRFYQPGGKIVNLDIYDNYAINRKKDKRNLTALLRKKLAIYLPLP